MNSRPYEKIIDIIKRNRICTAEVSDVLGKEGLFEHAGALNRGHFKVGRVLYAPIVGESNWHLHKAIEDAPNDVIVLIDDLGSGGRAGFGELVAKYLLLYRQSAAIVTNGYARDAHALIKENYPIWSKGVTPIGCFNTEVPMDGALEQTVAERKALFESSIMVCDDSGVVMIPEVRIDDALYEKLAGIEELEDIWFDCIDRRKWSTFETVCLKRYTNE